MSALPRSRRRTGFGLAWVSSAEYIGQPCNTSIRLDRVDFDRLNPNAPFSFHNELQIKEGLDLLVKCRRQMTSTYPMTIEVQLSIGYPMRFR